MVSPLKASEAPEQEEQSERARAHELTSSSFLSLERVPETGRLRFMDLSPASERQVAVQSFNEILKEYKPLLLPASHPTSKYVERVARRIVEGGGLGKMKVSSSVRSAGKSWGGGLFGDVGFGGGGGEEEWETKNAKNAPAGDEIDWEVSLVASRGRSRVDIEADCFLLAQVFVINDPKTKNA